MKRHISLTVSAQLLSVPLPASSELEERLESLHIIILSLTIVMEGKASTVAQVALHSVESSRQKGFEDPEVGRLEDVDIERVERVYR